MFGSLSEEVEVKVSASKAWDLYGTLKIRKVIENNIFEKVEIEGDGGVGTIIKLTLKPGLGFSTYTEKLTKVDNENMVKEVEVVEGGYLDVGFTLYRTRFEIKDNSNDNTSCLLKATIEYEIKEEFAANASRVSIQPIIAGMNIANEHLLKSN